MGKINGIFVRTLVSKRMPPSLPPSSLSSLLPTHQLINIVPLPLVSSSTLSLHLLPQTLTESVKLSSNCSLHLPMELTEHGVQPNLIWGGRREGREGGRRGREREGGRGWRKEREGERNGEMEEERKGGREKKRKEKN